MKKVIGLVFIAAVALGLGCEIKTSTVMQPSVGQLCFQVEPASAEVYADGKFVGRVNDFNEKCLELDTGKHHISLVKSGFASYEADIYVGQAQQFLKTRLGKAEKGGKAKPEKGKGKNKAK